jgi:hypothetical protein
MLPHYAHTLTFACPDCQQDITITRVVEYASLEAVDEMRFQIQCWSCEKSRDVPGYFAQSHTVKECRTEDP